MEKKFYYVMAMLFLMIIGFSACTASREREVEDDISSFRAWVNDQSARIADRTEADWERAKEDFKVRTAELDERQDNFSAELRQEYDQLKADFNNLDEERENRRRQAKVAEWEANLLGGYADKSTITKDNLQQVYIQLLENVRNMHGNWTDEDWEMAKLVLENLNDRKDEVDEDLPTDDEVKIKALQMEFVTLETAADVSDG